MALGVTALLPAASNWRGRALFSLTLEQFRTEVWKLSFLLYSNEHMHRASPLRAPNWDGQSSPHLIKRDTRMGPPQRQSDAQDPSLLPVPKAPLSSGAGRGHAGNRKIGFLAGAEFLWLWQDTKPRDKLGFEPTRAARHHLPLT